MKQTEIPYGYCQCGCGEKTKLAPQTHTEKGWVKDEPVSFVNGHYLRLANSRGDSAGEKHPRWTGDAISYDGLHHWIRRHFQKLGYCAFCEKEGRTEFANISGEYRRDIEDYVELCRPCHKKFDA